MTEFRRLVLELGHGAADLATMRQAAAFARLLDAELHALFIEDETLLHASALPFAREISPLSMRWRPLASERLEADLRAAADRAQRHLTEIARVAGVRRSFEVRRGDVVLHVTETFVVGDVVVVAPAPRAATHGTGRVRDTAHRSAASMLFLPPGRGRRHGPVVAVTSGPDDTALVVARRIAAQEKEVVVAVAGASVGEIAASLGDTRERLIVVPRSGGADIGAALAAARGVAVLMVEPG
jgi:hypothetical protein